MISARAFVAVGTVLSLLVAACQPATTPSGSSGVAATTEPPPPQELTIAVASLLPNFDPLATAGSWQGTKVSIFDTITRTDPKGNVIPWLAVSWKATQPTVWEFKLREQVKFSNGEPMDANATKFSIDRVKDPATKSPLAGRIPLVSGVEIVDPTTVRITTSKADAILPARLAAIFVMPPKATVELGTPQFGLKPVGTGPFQLNELVSDTRMVFSRFPESWRKTNLSKLTFLVLPDVTTRVAALRRGDVQMIADPPLDQLQQLQQEGIGIAATPAGWSYVADFDTVTEDTPLRDQRVRQALNYAVDKETILKQVFLGQGRVNDAQLVGPAGNGYDSSLKPYPFDPAKAKQLLAEAGYASGFTIRMESSAGSATQRRLTLAVQSYLRDVGVTASLDEYESAIWLDHFYGRSKRASMFYYIPQYTPAMDIDFTSQWYICSSGKKTFCNPDIDQLYTASTTELDPQKRLDLIKRMSAILRDQAVVLFLIEPNTVWGVSKKVSGFVPRADDQATYETITLAR